MNSSTARPRDASDALEQAIWRLLSGISDPEIPVLSILDLGIVRYVRCEDNGSIRVGITPTYSGCPATAVIQDSVQRALSNAGLSNAVVETVLSPPWTSEWITEEGRRKLARFGIAPPVRSTAKVRCPRCGSESTRLISEFGSTPCKAHYSCECCLEPFDHFKCI